MTSFITTSASSSIIPRCSRTAVLLSVLVACILCHTADAYDNAFIHTGCLIEEDHYPEYYTDGSWGAGWYCNDGVDVTNPNNLPDGMGFDDTFINDGCGAAGSLVQYGGGVGVLKETPEGWYCFDDGPWGASDWNSFIYPGCKTDGIHFPVYRYDADCPGGSCAFGEGWYCNDDYDVSDWDWNYFDNSFIRLGCDDCYDGECVFFNGIMNGWFCNDWVE